MNPVWRSGIPFLDGATTMRYAGQVLAACEEGKRTMTFRPSAFDNVTSSRESYGTVTGGP
jgi:hypothetical protein